MRSVPRAAAVAVVCAIAVMLVDAVPARAQVYTFQGLADTRPASKFSDFSPPAINDAGDIAFAARLKSGGSGIYKWSAATRTLVTIFEDPGSDWFVFHGFAYPALTPGGEVYFQYEVDRIRAGSGGALRVVVDAGDAATYGVPLASLPGPFACQQPRLRSRTATSGGRVAISCIVSPPIIGTGEGVYLTSGGHPARVCDRVTFSTIPNIFTRCFEQGLIEVSTGGTLAGIGSDPALLDPFGSPRQLLLRGDVNQLDIVLDPGVHTSALAFPNTSSRLGINDGGTITYEAYQDTPGGSGYAIFRIDSPGAPISVTDPRNSIYRFAVYPSINALGEIVFFDLFRNGLFNGPDPVANKVIIRTDTIPGYAIPGLITNVDTLIFQHPGINRLGELATIAFLGDGTLVITRITAPTNHPPDVTIGNQSSPEGTPVTVQVVASDQDGDYPLVYHDLTATPGPPAGTLSGPPPGLVIDHNTGVITGIPTPGTTGNRYATRVTVEDSRGLMTIVDIVWTITDSIPPPRINVIASTNLAAEAIDVSWQNPTPDTADEFWLGYSTTGSAGPFQQWGFGPLSQTSQRITDPRGSGLTYCFTAKGVVTRNGNRIFSLDSNIACTNYPQFTMSVQGPGVISTPTSATFTITTNMPADLTLVWPTPPPAGAQWSVTPDATNTIFTILITGLPSASTQTSYSVTLLGRTKLVGLETTRTVPFVTTAVTPPQPGPIQVGNSSPLRVDALDFVGDASSNTMSIDVRLRNTGSSSVANVAMVTVVTTLELDPGDLSQPMSNLVSQYCRISPQGTVATCSPITVTPDVFGTIGRGQTSPYVRMTFPLATFQPGFPVPRPIGGPGVHARLRIAVTYDGLNGSYDQLPEVRPSLPN